MAGRFTDMIWVIRRVIFLYLQLSSHIRGNLDRSEVCTVELHRRAHKYERDMYWQHTSSLVSTSFVSFLLMNVKIV